MSQNSYKKILGKNLSREKNLSMLSTLFFSKNVFWKITSNENLQNICIKSLFYIILQKMKKSICSKYNF